MSTDPLQYEKEYWADVIFKNLNGLTRSEDASLKFYAMELEKQNATEKGFREFSYSITDEFIKSTFPFLASLIIESNASASNLFTPISGLSKVLFKKLLSR